MSNFVQPKVYFVGFSEIDNRGFGAYLRDSGNKSFWNEYEMARSQGISTAEILCSMFAKLCYKSLSEGKNLNVRKVRTIENNLRATFDAGHGSVFEHVQFNFIAADCSRVFTHELVRHRVGTAFSQNSGRYIRLDSIDFVLDPCLKPCEDLIEKYLSDVEFLVYMMECRLGLRVPNPLDPNERKCEPEDFLEVQRNPRAFADPDYIDKVKWVPNDKMSMDEKKALTSAVRRVAPNGQSNEIAFTLNLRALRHTIMMRTARFAEWEIRYVFAEVYKLLKSRFPTIFHGAKEKEYNGILEITGMRTQPYELTSSVVLSELSDEQLEMELVRRRGQSSITT